MGQGSFSDGKETAGGKREGGSGFLRLAYWVGDLGRSCLFPLLNLGGLAGAGSMGVREEVFRFVIRVLGGWGKFRPVIFAGVELLRFP